MDGVGLGPGPRLVPDSEGGPGGNFDSWTSTEISLLVFTRRGKSLDTRLCGGLCLRDPTPLELLWVSGGRIGGRNVRGDRPPAVDDLRSLFTCDHG